MYAVPLKDRFRDITVREGVLVRGPRGWGDFCPFAEYDDAVAATWLGRRWRPPGSGGPPVRDRVPLNATVPAVGPDRAAEIVRGSGCSTAKVKVADAVGSAALAADAARVAAVREALGPGGHVRVDANGRWTVDEAVRALDVLDEAAGGLQYAEQPCASVPELADLRPARTCRSPRTSRSAARRTRWPSRGGRRGRRRPQVHAPWRGAPLAGGGRGGRECACPSSMSSALESGVGMAAELALAGALPRLELACGLGTRALLTGDVTAEPSDVDRGRHAAGAARAARARRGAPRPVRPARPRPPRVVAGPPVARTGAPAPVDAGLTLRPEGGRGRAGGGRLRSFQARMRLG